MSGTGRFLRAALALTCIAAGGWLALHHPLGGVMALALFAVATTASACWSRLWLVALPALLPLIALAPWSGWLIVEEWDLLLLACVGGAYARAAFARPAAGPATLVIRPLAALVLMLFAVSTALAAWRGLADAGGFAAHWFAGYREPLNSLRAAKGFVAALLLWPLLRDAARRDAARTWRELTLGLGLGLAGICAVTLWERYVFTGLANFSTDYRTTGPFWEMHVGGAALDGFLALGAPFALKLWFDARDTAARIGSAALLLALAYASLTTFSRGVYVGVPVALLLGAALHARHAPRPVPTNPMSADEGRFGPLGALLLWLAFVLAALRLFPGGGYRVLLALLGAAALLLPLVAAGLQRPSPRIWPGVAVGLVIAAVVAATASRLPKGAYLLYGVAWGAGAVALWLVRRGHAIAWQVAIAAAIVVSLAIAVVARFWGGEPAGTAAWPVAMLLAALLTLLLALRGGLQAPLRRIWPAGPQLQAGLLMAMGATAVAVGIALGGDYMGSRVATSRTDLGDRFAHWRHSFAMLTTPAELAFGKGLGRYPESYAIADPIGDRPGDYRLIDVAGERALLLTSGRHVQGWGEMLRLSQRIGPLRGLPMASATARLRVHVREPVELHLEVCSKHLLYDAGCVGVTRRIEASAEAWRWIELHMPEDDHVGAGTWYAPRPTVFSVAIEQTNARLAISRIELVTDSGARPLVNGDFSAGLAHWFFSSDRHHLPWHAKSLLLHLCFEQGVLGLLLAMMLWGGAVWRTSLGAARQHPLAAPVAGALVGCMAVGLFDSLLDVPRFSFLWTLLFLLGLGLRAPAAAARTQPAGGSR